MGTYCFSSVLKTELRDTGFRSKPLTDWTSHSRLDIQQQVCVAWAWVVALAEIRNVKEELCGAEDSKF